MLWVSWRPLCGEFRLAEEFRQSATDSLGLPTRMWWLWPFVALLIVIWTISLWAVRVADTEEALGVVTSHRGLGTAAQAEVALLFRLQSEHVCSVRE